MNKRTAPRFYAFPQTWLGRAAAGIAAALLLVAAFFFIFLFLLVAGVLILGFSLRLLWRARQAKGQASREAVVLEGEYSVEPQDKAPEIPRKE